MSGNVSNVLKKNNNNYLTRRLFLLRNCISTVKAVLAGVYFVIKHLRFNPYMKGISS